jgi:hypothetical protein
MQSYHIPKMAEVLPALWRNVLDGLRTEVSGQEEDLLEWKKGCGMVGRRRAVSSVVMGAFGLCLRREDWRFHRSLGRIGWP